VVVFNASAAVVLGGVYLCNDGIELTNEPYMT